MRGTVETQKRQEAEELELVRDQQEELQALVTKSFRTPTKKASNTNLLTFSSLRKIISASSSPHLELPRLAMSLRSLKKMRHRELKDRKQTWSDSLFV